MTHLMGKERSLYMTKMFSRISKTYDKLNRIITFRQDLKWRKEAVKFLEAEHGAVVLDLGTGTGAIPLEVLHQHPNSFVVGVDLTPEMIHLAHTRTESNNVHWVIADVHNLPFPPTTFSATISAFLLRNVPEIDPVLLEQQRVLRNGGMIVCLETTTPVAGPLRSIIAFYIHRVIPSLGMLISRESEAYAYLAVSTAVFLSAERLWEQLNLAGFKDAGFVRRMLGTIAIHHARKS